MMSIIGAMTLSLKEMSNAVVPLAATTAVPTGTVTPVGWLSTVVFVDVKEPSCLLNAPTIDDHEPSASIRTGGKRSLALVVGIEWW